MPTPCRFGAGKAENGNHFCHYQVHTHLDFNVSYSWVQQLLNPVNHELARFLSGQTDYRQTNRQTISQADRTNCLAPLHMPDKATCDKLGRLAWSALVH